MKKEICRRQFTSETPLPGSRLAPVLQRVFSARGIRSEAELNTQLKGLLPPENMKGLAQAATLLANACEQQARVLVVGDFDADGATSSALALLALRAMGFDQVDFLVPNRFEFGYGLTPEIVEVATSFKPDLIVTVDNGISSLAGVAAAKEYGIKVLVTDHHLPGDSLPNADAIVNPNQPGCQFASKNLAGVGVIFYVMSALRAELRNRDWFSLQNITEPNMGRFLDLVALGTVADVVPLDHNNRILVQQGLLRIRAGQARPGIMALLEISARQPQRLVASDLGFTVGPRLNAAGRLDDMSLGIQCLLTEDHGLARDMAVQLNDLNQDRKAIEAGMQQEALASLQALELEEEDLPWGLCLHDDNWHQGVIGILASRIKDRFHRPVIAFADAGENDRGEAEIKGSARSINGLHIRDALDAVAAKHPQLLQKFGGHAMAAGMSFLKKDFQAFFLAFDNEVRRLLSDSDLQAKIFSDGELQAGDFSLAFAQQLRDAGPWGQAFAEPVFDGEFYILQQRIVGQKHLKLLLSRDKAGRDSIDAIAFNVDLELWPNQQAEKLNLAYRLDINEFRGQQSVQLMAEYLEAI